ncbi:hypothetical protein [Glycomyces algeriensis]|uniref:Heavy metal transporter n=1 Tax=Glycomyces algeriensis TaxID=256037 RepID=A0A9W6LIL0_9ACTN|nr:hypothetical protein [Glycomyces algeriensis]MDR7352452.1 hypothetical protein [Glycomyces algeriensis]GLI45192.1 hypothetical protein GALLR39Z86_50420 [Glycomyces algeriensis]
MRALPALTSLFLLAALTACTEDARDALRPSKTGCYVGSASEVHLSAEQASNAATIAAVGMRDGMDEHAVAVAITTAMQESELINVDYGHDDSLGLFQQRPSMGWGSEEELMDPVYASFKFYEKLQRTDGWQDMRLAEAAQAVQISAYPELYEQWESDAEVIADAFAGGEEAGLVCVSGSADEKAADPAALAEAYEYHWGTSVSDVEETRLVIETGGAAEGWNRAAWAVARAYDHHIATVSFNGMVWTAGEEEWSEPAAEVDGDADGEAQVVEVADSTAVLVTFAAPE